MEPAARPAEATDQRGAEADAEASKPRILVTEDDRHMRRLISATLRKDGYEVVEAEGGVDLLDWIELADRSRAAIFDAIVSDVQMPGRTAIEVLSARRGPRWKTPVILISAYADEVTRTKAHELGAHILLTKPVDMNDLRAVVHGVVPLHRARPEEQTAAA